MWMIRVALIQIQIFMHKGLDIPGIADVHETQCEYDPKLHHYKKCFPDACAQ